MASKSLIDKIEALPAEKKAEVEHFVESLARESKPTEALSDEFLARIDARRERLLREHGLFDSMPILRELREKGGR